MTRFIRWQGIIGFLSVIIFLAAFVFIFAGSFIKAGLEKSGEWYLGAEVNVEEVEVNLFPLSLTIIGFQATDSEKPTHNMVSFSKAAVSLDVWQYLLGKIYIDDLAITQLEMDKKRKSPGDVYFTSDSKKSGEVKDATNGFTSIDTSLPSIDSLLKNANLETVKQAKRLQESYKAEQAKLAGIQASLPSKEKLADYKKQVKSLTETKVKSIADVDKVTKAFTELKDKFNADKEIISRAKTQLLQSKDLLNAQIQQLKNAPQEDWLAIEKKYQLQSVNTGDFAHIFFGEQAREYLGYVEKAYQKLSPLLTGKSATSKTVQTRKNGEFVYFSEQSPQPSVLIKKAHISLILTQGDIVIEGQALTHQHWKGEQLSVVKMYSSNLQGQGEFTFDMTFSLDKQQTLKSDGKWQLANLSVADIAIQKSSALSLSLNQAVVSAKGTFNLLADQVVSKNDIAINKADFNGEASSSLSSMLLETITSMDNLSLNVNAKGKITSPELTVSSSLDKQLKNVLQKQLSEKLSNFKGEINAGLNKKLASALGDGESKDKAFIDLESLISTVDGSLTDLLNSDVTQGHKNQLKDKIKKKLGNLFGG